MQEHGQRFANLGELFKTCAFVETQRMIVRFNAQAQRRQPLLSCGADQREPPPSRCQLLPSSCGAKESYARESWPVRNFDFQLSTEVRRPLKIRPCVNETFLLRLT